MGMYVISAHVAKFQLALYPWSATGCWWWSLTLMSSLCANIATVLQICTWNHTQTYWWLNDTVILHIFRILLSSSNFDCQLCKTLKVWQVSTSYQSCLQRTKQEWNYISHPTCGFRLYLTLYYYPYNLCYLYMHACPLHYYYNNNSIIIVHVCTNVFILQCQYAPAMLVARSTEWQAHGCQTLIRGLPSLFTNSLARYLAPKFEISSDRTISVVCSVPRNTNCTCARNTNF